MLEIQKGKNAIEELKFSSYLVHMAPKIIHIISQNQLVKIKGENTSRAPTVTTPNEMVKWGVKKKLFLSYLSCNLSRDWYFNSFFQAYDLIYNQFDGAIE